MIYSIEPRCLEGVEFLQLVGLRFFEGLATGSSANLWSWVLQNFCEELPVRQVGLVDSLC